MCVDMYMSSKLIDKIYIFSVLDLVPFDRYSWGDLPRSKLGQNPHLVVFMEIHLVVFV